MTCDLHVAGVFWWMLPGVHGRLFQQRAQQSVYVLTVIYEYVARFCESTGLWEEVCVKMAIQAAYEQKAPCVCAKKMAPCVYFEQMAPRAVYQPTFPWSGCVLMVLLPDGVMMPLYSIDDLTCLYSSHGWKGLW